VKRVRIRAACSDAARSGREASGKRRWWACCEQAATYRDGLLKLLAGALNALEVVAQGASNGLFDRVGSVPYR